MVNITNIEKPWASHYKSACSRAKYKSGKYYKRGLRMEMSEDDFKSLWFRDKAAAMKQPSIDRKNDKLGYIESNCQFSELSENIKKSIYHFSKLNIRQVKEIRKKYVCRKYTQDMLAEEYGVHVTTIHRIIKKIFWKDV